MTPKKPVTAVGMELLRRYPTDVISDISPKDGMYVHDPSDDAVLAYFAHGRAALDAIRLVLLMAQKDTVASVLDLPSGYGRVMRFIHAEYPDAHLTACDVIRDGVDFCAEKFGAEPLYGRERPSEVRTEQRFDLIWCGSLLTHVEAPTWTEFLDFFQSVLAPGGVLVFTTNGRSVAAQLRDPKVGRLFIPDEPRNEIVRAYDEGRFGYADYVVDDDFRASMSLPDRYGLSLTHPDWVCGLVAERPGLQLLSYMENRWAAQDVVACLAVEDVSPQANPLQIPLAWPSSPRLDGSPGSGLTDSG